jgi:hypothetical protein
MQPAPVRDPSSDAHPCPPFALPPPACCSAAISTYTQCPRRFQLVALSINHYGTEQYDNFQTWTNGILA